MARLALLVTLLSFVVSLQLVPGVHSTTFTFVNNCDYTVWPGIVSNAGQQPLSSTGFALDSGASNLLAAPAAWGGCFWGRTHCSQDSDGKFSCLTGDCGSGQVECSGSSAAPPATLAEFTLDGAGGMDFFDVSLVDGYNLPLLVAPQGGTGRNCTTTGCVVDLNGACPSELRVTSSDGSGGVACKSACEAFQQPEYCCSGAYATPQTCKPSSYSQLFKDACPQAYTYANDDSTSTFTCADADYVITFCPSPNAGQKSTSSSSAANFWDLAPPFDSSAAAYEGTKSKGFSASQILATFGGLGGLATAASLGWYLRGKLVNVARSSSQHRCPAITIDNKGPATITIDKEESATITSSAPKHASVNKKPTKKGAAPVKV